MLTAAADGLSSGTQDLRVTLFPAEVQTFYLPLPANQLLNALQAISGNTTPAYPIQIRAVITTSSDATIIYYDQMENGFEAVINVPTSIYNPIGNPSGTQIWGDGDPSNGFPPGFPDDLIPAGSAITLANPILNGQPTVNAPLFNAGDKIAATKGIAVTWAGWSTGPNTLLAGANEVYDTLNWGTEFRVPVGVNIPDGTDFQMFEYTGAAIMAGRGGATVFRNNVQIAVLTEGQSHLINNGLNVNDVITSNNPVQVDLLTGDIGSNYESRFFRLLPTDLWANSYYTPVSTRAADATTAWLYNPGASPINVTYRRRVSGNLSTSIISVPANSYAKVVLPDATGAQFFTAGGQEFYALSTTDSNDGIASENQAWDWGFTLVPETSLTPQLLVGLGFGRDPTSGVNPNENGNPVWVTTVGNGDTAVTVYVDYQNGTAALTDPNGFLYNVSYSLRELDQQKIYNPSGNQTGMLIYTIAPGVKLVGAWGQDPVTASAGEPGIDMGTGIPPLPRFSAVKRSLLIADNDGDGFISPGDDIEYEIRITNISRVPVSDMTLQDTLPDAVVYLANTTRFENELGIVSPIVDNPAAPVFPLTPPVLPLTPTVLNGGASLLPGATWKITYDVRLKAFEDLPENQADTFINAAIVNSKFVNDPIFLKDAEPIYGRIGNFVWFDVNQDGIQNPGEAGIAGVTVRLYDDSGTLLATRVTDPTGFYQFTGLLSGNYRVEFERPSGYVFSTFNADNNGLRGPMNSDVADPATGSTGVFALLVGEPLMQVDAGLYDNPTSVSIQEFAVDSVSLSALQDELELDAASALSLLSQFDAASANALAGASLEDILAALRQAMDADGDGTVAVVHWLTREERGTMGFYVERSNSGNGGWQRLNSEQMLLAFVTAPLGGEYLLLDVSAKPGQTYSYRLIEEEI